MSKDKIKRQMEQNSQDFSDYWSCEYYYGKYDSGFCSNKKKRFFKKECPYKGEECKGEREK